MDRYLLSSQVFIEFFKKSDPAINAFLSKVGGSRVYISSLTLGIVKAAIDAKPPAERARFEPYFKDGKKAFEGRILPADDNIAEQWALIRPVELFRTAGGAPVGEDEKLIIATAMEQGMVYLGKVPVTDPADLLESLGLIIRDPWQDPL